ncbi:MAG: NAD-dependent epimerase/dehydratase family protein [Ilumatobacteraceae bacterium]
MTGFAKVVVTGGAGLIGSHVVDLLVDGQAAGTVGEIVVLDNLTRGRPENLADATRRGDVDLIEGDILDRPMLDSVMRSADLVFHLAALRITRCAEDPRLAVDVLGMGTFNVIDAAHRAGVGRMVASSTASVYGLADTFPTDELHHPYNNRTMYGAIKTFNEGVLRAYHDMYGFDYVALRYFNVYGPRMDAHGKYTEVLIRWMERIAAGEAPLIFGDGKQTMDFVHVRDIASANLAAAHSDATDRVFNVATQTETSLDDLAHRLSQVMGSTMEPEYLAERSVNPVPRRLADITAAREVLAWEPEIGLDEGLRSLVEWWEAERRSGA